MKRKRRFEIVVETERRITLRRSAGHPRCGQCSGLLVFADEAVAVTGHRSRTIHRLAETGKAHFAETPAGALLVCPDSFRSDAG